jgi:enoyl-CoA hydratase/carnithine racemase
MAKFDEYYTRYQTVKMERQDGILLMTLHTDGKELRWGSLPHGELPQAFRDVGGDRDNRVVILTGTGSEFSGPRPAPAGRYGRPIKAWDNTVWEGRYLLKNLLDIEVPMIGAVNGPALRHSELPLLCDIVLADETACFEDSGHFQSGLVPGDGVNIVYPLLLGMNRGRYFLFTGQSIGAREAQQLGLVAEVLPKERLMARAWEHARSLAKHPDMHLRNTRLVLTEYMKRQLQEYLGYSLTLEAMANMDRGPPPAGT